MEFNILIKENRFIEEIKKTNRLIFEQKQNAIEMVLGGLYIAANVFVKGCRKLHKKIENFK